MMRLLRPLKGLPREAVDVPLFKVVLAGATWPSGRGPCPWQGLALGDL